MGNITHTITINANTSQAKANLQELQSQLKALQSIPISADVTGLQAARQEINQLTQSLHTAMNPNTGKLDLSVFSNQLAKTGKSLSDYKNALFSMGTQGQQAFLSLANAIATAEAPTNRLNQRVLQFGKTLKNTINWQLSSSLIHGIVGQVQKAINYAEKLNTSLNNIQIVTGQNNAKMAEFARQANQTAKQLSTTTTEYTNASLIYYQQGLSDSEVAKRTETTLKLANVTRQSAQIVSDQMTAIWNNYAEGSDNLEHYADVITALGAATASSSAEIAGGLEKFASVSKTVGLSYNYATTALATIVATTRQNEDTVGTGLRTIFSRLQSLKLGKTLEDGVGLTKYSAALKTVGIDILDSLGHIKDMDKILDELGAKWQTISREQQIALAQTVGGVRQYTNLMALMNNWDKFQKNLKVAEGADGTLQTQAERYASGWEAARKRVQASAEGIYDSLIDDQAMIKVTNVFSGFLDIINGLVAGFGGLKGIIPSVLALLASSAAKNAPEFFSNIRANWNTLTGKSIKNMSGVQGDLDNILSNLIGTSTDDIYKMELQKLRDSIFMKQSLLKNAHRMSNVDQAAYQQKIEGRELLWQAAISAAQNTKAKEDAQEAFIQNQVKIKSVQPSEKTIATATNEVYKDLIKAYENKTLTNDIQDRLTGALSIDHKLNKLNESIQQDTQNIHGLVNNNQSIINQAIQANRTFVTAQQEEITARTNFEAAVRNSQAYRGETNTLQNISTEIAHLEQEATTAPALRQTEIAQRIATLRAQYRTTNNRREKLFDETQTSPEAMVEQARQAYLTRIEARQNVQTAKTDADKAVHDAKDKLTKAIKTQADHISAADEREAHLTSQILHEEATKVGKLEAQNIDTGVQQQKDFLETAYEHAGLLQDEQAQNLLQKAGWKFGPNGQIKVGSALTTDVLQQKNLTTAEQAIINRATKAATAPLVEATQKATHLQTSRDLLANNIASLDPKLQSSLLKGNIIDQAKGLRSLGADTLKQLRFNQKWQKFASMSDEDFQKLSSEDIWQKVLKATGIEDPAAIDDVAKKMAKSYQRAATGAAAQQAQEEANKEVEQREKEARDNGVQNVQGVREKAADTEDSRTRTNWQRTSITNRPEDTTPTESNIQTAMLAGSALTTMISTLNNTANNLNTILDSSATGAEKFGAVLSEAASLLMTFALVTKFANEATIQAAITKKAEQGSVIAGALGKMGPGGIGIAVTAIMAIVGIAKGIVQKVQKEEQESRQNTIKTGNEAYDRLTKNKELTDSQTSLVNAYKAAARAVEKGTATEQELQQAKQQLVESLLKESESGYSNKNAVAYAYAGNMNAVQAQLDENRRSDIRNEKNKIQARQKAAGLELQNAVGKIFADTLTATDYDGIASNLLQNAGGAYDVYNGATNYYISPGSSPQKLYEQYQTLLQMQEAYIAQGGSQTSDFYKKLTGEINKLSSYAEDYGKYQQQLEQLDIEALGLGESIDGYYVGNANAIIKDVKTYNDYRKKLINKSSQKFDYQEGTAEYDQMVNNIDAFLGSVSSVTGHKLGNLQHISTGIENVIDYQKENYEVTNPIDQNRLRNSLISAYETYGDALFEIGTKYKLPLNFDKKAITPQLQPIFDLIQARANENKIKLQLDVIANFDFSKTHSVEEWQTFFEDLSTKAWESVNGKLNKGNFVALPEFLKTEAVERYRAALIQERYGHTLDETIGAQESTLTYLEGIKAGRQQTFDNTKFAQEAENGYGWRSRDQWLQTNSSAVLEYLTLKNKETKTSDDKVRLSALTSALGEDNIAQFINSSNIDDIEAYVSAFEALAQAESDVASAEADLDKSKALKSAYKEFGYNEDIANKAAAKGVKYDDVLQQAYAMQHGLEFQGTEASSVWEKDNEGAQEAALALLNQQAGLESLSSSYKDWLKVLNDSNSSYTKVAAASTALQQSLAKIMNVNFDKVSKGLYEWAKQAGNLDKLLNGDKNAWGEAFQLQARAVLDGIEKLNEPNWNKIKDKWSDFAKDQAQLDFGETVDPGKVKEFISDMRAAGFSVQEINEAGRQVFNTTDDVLTTVGETAVNAGDTIDGVVNSLDSLPDVKEVYIAQNTDEPQTEDIPLGGESKIVGSAAATGDGLLSDSGGDLSVTGEITTAGTATVLAPNGNVRSNGTGGKQKGGGGGGGKKEPHKPKRYRNIENQIQNNKRKTDAASRNKDRAVGAAKLEYLEKERELREENLKLEQQYQKEIEDWLDKDRDKMMEAFAAINFTPIFDEAGEVINNDAFELAFEAIGDGSDEAWKKAEEALAQYEETLDKLNDKLEEIQELQDAIYDAALEATKLKLDLQLDVSIDRFEYLDYLLDKIDDDAYQAAEAIALLGDKTAETMKKVNTYTTGLEDILSRHGFSLSDLDNLSVEDLNAAGFTQSEIDQIKEWRSELLKANQDLLEMRKTIIDKVINAFDNLNEKVQKSYDKFNAYNSVLEKYKNITDLMGRNMSAQSRQIMNQLSNTMLRNAQNTAAAARRIYEDAEMEMAQAQLAYQLAVSSGDQEAIRRWQEVIDATSEHLQEAEEQWLESWNNALEQAKTMFEDMMEQIQEDYSATMGSTFGSLDYLQAAYDRQKEIGEMYERDFDRLYDLSKLSRDISKAIDDNDNIKGKQKLRALQAEINKLQADGTRLSEYDVEVLRKKFELEQARLALDDAQNAKSQVRLQRDANGNWGYVYTANEDKIEEAEQAYEDKLHEYQVLNDDYINQLQDKALEVQQTWSEVVGKIYSDLGLGVITDEEAATRLAEANQWLNEQRAYFEEQSNHALENQASLYDRTLNTYHIASAEIVDTWGETNLALLTKIDELQAYMNNWNEASETFLSHSAEVIDKYKEDIDKINDMAGISTTKFENHIDSVVVNINDMSDDTLTSVNDLSEAMRNEFSSALSEAVSWELQYVDAMDTMINHNETFVKSLNLMIEKLAGVNTSITEMLTPLETLDNIINQSTTPVYYQNSLSELTGTSAQHILSLLNANIAAYSAGLGELSMSGVNGLTTTIDQNVTINAAFPNATNHSEIEEAFTNLINKASQYANRKGL